MLNLGLGGIGVVAGIRVKLITPIAAHFHSVGYTDEQKTLQ
jgi:hypothetical protein